MLTGYFRCWSLSHHMDGLSRSLFSITVVSLGADWQCLLLQAEYFYEFLSLRSLDKGIMADPTVNVPLLGTVPHKASGEWSLL